MVFVGNPERLDASLIFIVLAPLMLDLPVAGSLIFVTGNQNYGQSLKDFLMYITKFTVVSYGITGLPNIKLVHAFSSIVALVMFVTMLAITQTYADELSESYDGIVVEGAYVQTDDKVPVSILKLKISNFSSNNLTLIGVEAEKFTNARLLMNDFKNGIIQIESLSILQEETLNLDTSHIWIELSGLKRAIQAGEKIEFDLLFAAGKVRANADIHSSKS